LYGPVPRVCCGRGVRRRALKRLGYWRLVAIGLAVAAVGVAGCASPSWTVAIFSVGVYGCGLGVVIPASNFGVAASATGDSARRVLWLNLFWSIGAVTAPALIASLKTAFLPCLAAAFVGSAILVAFRGTGPWPA